MSCDDAGSSSTLTGAEPPGTSTSGVGAAFSVEIVSVTAVGMIDFPSTLSGCATNHASISELAKNTTASPVVSLVKKLPEPREPNTVPDAPPPNAAPASAPLPCCIKTKPMIPSETSIWMISMTL